MTQKRSVSVTIAGQRLPVRTDADEAYVRKLARFVDQRLEEAKGGSRPIQTQKLAILAALNIADELFRERTKLVELKAQVSQRAANMLAYLEKEEKRSFRTKGN